MGDLNPLLSLTSCRLGMVSLDADSNDASCRDTYIDNVLRIG